MEYDWYVKHLDNDFEIIYDMASKKLKQKVYKNPPNAPTNTGLSKGYKADKTQIRFIKNKKR